MSIDDEIAKFGSFRKDYGWQEESIETFMRQLDVFYSSEPGQFQRAYLNEVSPSGGKSVFSMKLGRRLIVDGLIDKTVTCVPRDSIKLGFEDDTRHVIMPEGHRLLDSAYFRMDTTLDNNYRGLLNNYHGIVLTYQSLPGALPYLQLLANTYRLAFVFDEAHHGATGDEDEAMNVWASAMEECRRVAHSVVLLTGTPLRADTRQVQFVQYKEIKASDGRTGFQVQPDYSFNYAKAVTAGVARKIICRSQNPDITYDVTELNEEGEEETHTYCMPANAIPSTHFHKVKNTAFDFNRGVVDDLLKIAFEECQLMRETGDPDAAILVIGRRDMAGEATLSRIKARIKALFQEDALTVESADGPAAREAIRRFKRGTDRWIVAKEMISEGTSLPRIRSVVILRDIGNRTFYEQLVHRITRNDADDRPQDAIIVQLKFPHLHAWGTDLENQATIAWEARKKIEKERERDGMGGHKDLPFIQGIAAEMQYETVVMEGDDFTDVDPTGRKIHAMVGQETKTSRWQLNKVLRGLSALGINLGGAAPENADKELGELFPVEEQFKRIKDRALTAVRATAVNLGGNHAFGIVTAECKKEAGIKGKFENVLREHPKPLEAIKAFERAALNALRRSKGPDLFGNDKGKKP